MESVNRSPKSPTVRLKLTSHANLASLDSFFPTINALLPPKIVSNTLEQHAADAKTIINLPTH
jgi:hypothetical protein